VIPAGEYEITGYRIAARDESGVEWFLAATQPFMRELEVVDGETLHIEIDPRIHLAMKSSEQRVDVMVHGDQSAGMSIYRGGRRIPLDFKVMTPNGELVTQGSFHYG
jgi:hypothetical protein